MVAYSLAFGGRSSRQFGARVAADGTITILGQTRKPFFFRPRRELNDQHTPNSFRRRSRLGEK